jgi:outer membrane lipoprotein-sorting protein
VNSDLAILKYTIFLVSSWCLYGYLFGAIAPADVDPALWLRMQDVNARAANVHDILADFTQEKFTSLLKKPLVSKGVIRATTSVMRWETTSPEPTVMRIDVNSAAIYYPQEKLEEVYPITGQLGSLAASPLPRLDVLAKHFHFAAENANALDPATDDQKCLALKMTPIDESLREHVQQVRVLIDVATGLMLRVEVADADGDRTVISFSNVRVNTNPPDPALPIDLPPGVKVERPLESLGAEAPTSSQPTK